MLLGFPMAEYLQEPSPGQRAEPGLEPLLAQKTALELGIPELAAQLAPGV